MFWKSLASVITMFCPDMSIFEESALGRFQPTELLRVNQRGWKNGF